MAKRNRPPGSMTIENVAPCSLCGGQLRVIIGSPANLYCCRQCGPDKGRGLLAGLADAEGVRVADLLSPQWAQNRWSDAQGMSAASAGTRALPSAAHVAGWHSALLASKRPLDWLTNERGVPPRIVRKARLGWTGEQITFPMYRHGKFVALKTRAPGSGGQMRAWRGRGRLWPLYPEPRNDEEWVLLVAGELDALAGRGAGLPACSVTLGAGTWRDDWVETLRGRLVVVCFDNNEQHLASERVRMLHAEGVRATRLDLRALGLEAPKGDLSDFMKGERRKRRRTPTEDLGALVKRRRREAG